MTQQIFSPLSFISIFIIGFQYEVKVTCNNLGKTRIWNIFSTNLSKRKHQGNLGHEVSFVRKIFRSLLHDFNTAKYATKTLRLICYLA